MSLTVGVGVGLGGAGKRWEVGWSVPGCSMLVVVFGCACNWGGVGLRKSKFGREIKGDRFDSLEKM